jgi:hypothetical protein
MRVSTLILPLVLAGCADAPILVMQDNYISFEHPFTDEAASRVRARAETLCAQRKQAAIKTQSACSLSKCFTSYQCVPKAAAATVTQ